MQCISEVDSVGYSVSPAFQYYDFHSSCSSYKNARVCVNYAEGLHFVAFAIAAGAVHPVWVGFNLQIDSCLIDRFCHMRHASKFDSIAIYWYPILYDECLLL